MASILSQAAFESYSDVEVLGDLKRLRLAFDGIDDEALMRKLERKRGHGRDDFPVRVMWNLFIAMIVFCHKSVESFRRELDRNPTLCKMCGLHYDPHRKNHIPPARVFSGFTKRLKSFQDEVDRMFGDLTRQLAELIPGFGKNAAGDGKYLDSAAKRPPTKSGETDDRSENDAKFSTKEYKYRGADGKDHVKKETHFGFKVHVICDVPTELPIIFSVSEANADERAEMVKLINLLAPGQRAAMDTIALDRGYDSIDMIRALKHAGIIPIIDIRDCWKDGESTKQYKNTNMIYTFDGKVFYEDNDGPHKMSYEGYDCQKKCLRYSYKGKTYKIYTSYDERVFLPIARDSKKFKRLYKARTTVERLNSRLDNDYMFEEKEIRGIQKMRLMASLSLLIMNGMAVAKARQGIKSIRSLKRAG